MDVRFSALRHGVALDDIRHAVEHPIRTVIHDEVHIIIGPARDGQLLEIGVRDTDRGVTVVHAMRARRKYLR